MAKVSQARPIFKNKFGQPRPLAVIFNFCFFTNLAQKNGIQEFMKIEQMMCLVFEPKNERRKAQMNPLSYACSAVHEQYLNIIQCRKYSQLVKHKTFSRTRRNQQYQQCWHPHSRNRKMTKRNSNWHTHRRFPEWNVFRFVVIFLNN